MKQVRLGVFETNSSSTHSLTMCSQEQYNDWKQGKLYFKRYGGTKEFYEASELTQADIDDGDYETYDQWGEDDQLEIFENTYKTLKGEVVVAFGKYGYDG